MPHYSISILISASICWFQYTASALSGYDNSRLHRLAQASSLSYLTIDKMSSSPYLEKSNLTPVTQVVDTQSESGATIFRAFDDIDSGVKCKIMVVACRGSATPLNFRTNLRFSLVPATQLSLDFVPENALVHEGFQMASVGLWRELSQSLTDHLDSSISEIIFTGHSLGAATALLCAAQYNNSFKEFPPPSTFTFGGPKLCNSVLARHLRDEVLMGCDILHLIHTSDPVLASNKKLWDSLGFENAGIEVECDPYVPLIWGENARKAPIVAWNIVDHCKYMVSEFAFFVTTRHINEQILNYKIKISRGYMWAHGFSFRGYSQGPAHSYRYTFRADLRPHFVLFCQLMLYSSTFYIDSSNNNIHQYEV